MSLRKTRVTLDVTVYDAKALRAFTRRALKNAHCRHGKKSDFVPGAGRKNINVEKIKQFTALLEYLDKTIEETLDKAISEAVLKDRNQ